MADDFDPRELDLLEDALEGLEDIDELASLELAPALTERLAEYQDVLALCREAFPIEAPREELLADVIAEAHAVSRRPKRHEPDGGRARRFWERWRGTLIPGVALAGTAAAVLLLLEPGPQDQPSATLLIDTNTNQNNDAKAEPKLPSEPSIDEGEPADEDPEQPDDAGEQLDDADADADAEQPEPPEPLGKSSPVKKRRSNKASAPAQAPEPAPEPMSKDDTWLTLERGDASRRKGDCDRARARYEQVIAAGSDTSAVARAKAGIGLCHEQDRRNGEADGWFDQARADDPGIGSWIKEERDRQPLPGEKKKKSKLEALEADAL